MHACSIRAVAGVILLLGAGSASANCTGLTSELEFTPWFEGKYHKLRYETIFEPQMSPRLVEDFLAMADLVWEIERDFFAWPYVQPGSDSPERGFEHTIQRDVSGAGTGIGGSCWSPGEFGLHLPGERPRTDDGARIDSTLLATIVHEGIHLWDFRGQRYFQGPDIAHPLTVGIDRVINGLTGVTFHSQFPDLAGPTDPYHFSRWTWNFNWDRYLATPELSWESFFSEAAFDELLAGETSLRSAYDRLAIQGAILHTLLDAHGLEALQDVFAEVEQHRLENPNFPFDPNRPNAAALENFIRFVGQGLQRDVTSYFDFWRYPISTELRAELAAFPAPDGLDDADGDGFSKLEGDLDDDDPAVFPGAPELADGLDNNLDGLIDELFIVETADFDEAAPMALTLPATVRGEIGTLDDVDRFTFETTERALVSVFFRSVSGNAASSEDFEVLDWLVTIDGNFVGFPTGDQRTTALPAGEHVIRIATLPEAPSGGSYELQVFVNDIQVPDLVSDELRYEFKAYPLAPDPAFDCADATGVAADSCAALVAIYDGFGGEDWLDTRGWLNAPDPCYWRGVRCGRDGLWFLYIWEIERFSPDATLTAEMLDLPTIRTLYLDGDFRGRPVPDAFDQMPLLENLSIRFGLGGPFPESIGELTQLRTLFLSDSQLTGELPPSLAELDQLQSLEIERTALTGPLPDGLRHIDTLTTLRFDAADQCVQSQAFIDWLGTLDDVTPGPYVTCFDTLESSISEATSGTWFNPETPGQGMLVEVDDATGQMFVAWFTYGGEAFGDGPASVRRWYTAQGSFEGDSAELGLFLTTGGVLGADDPVSTDRVGTLTLRFDGCNTATASYRFDQGPIPGPIAGEFAMNRLTAGAECPGAAASPLTGGWFDLRFPGQGLLIDVDPSGNVFVGWFVFNAADEEPDQAWFTAAGTLDPATGVADLAVTRTTGGQFDDTAPVSNEPAGNLQLRFDGCAAAQASYAVEGNEGDYTLLRLFPDC